MELKSGRWISCTESVQNKMYVPWVKAAYARRYRLLTVRWSKYWDVESPCVCAMLACVRTPKRRAVHNSCSALGRSSSFSASAEAWGEYSSHLAAVCYRGRRRGRSIRDTTTTGTICDRRLDIALQSCSRLAFRLGARRSTRMVGLSPTSMLQSWFTWLDLVNTRACFS